MAFRKSLRRSLALPCICTPVLAVLLQAEPALSRSPAGENGNAVVWSVLESGNPNLSLSEGYTTLETAQTECLYGTSCTLAMTVMASISNGACNDQWAIVGLVDGNSVDGGPLQSVMPGTGNQQTTIWQGIAKLTHGDHTASFQIYVPCSATATQWSVKYTLTSR